MPPLDEYFAVEFDDEVVRIDVSPPEGQARHQEFRWADIERVCFKAEGPILSDGIYVFTGTRPESYVIPVDARGGNAFWAEVIERRLFDANLAIEAASALEGLFCWPPLDEPDSG